MSGINSISNGASENREKLDKDLKIDDSSHIYLDQENFSTKLSKDQLLKELFEGMEQIQVILDEEEYDSMDRAYVVYKNIIREIDFNDHITLSAESKESIDVLGNVFSKHEKEQQQKNALEKEKQNRIKKQREEFEQRVKNDAEDAVELMVKMKFGDIEKGKFLYKDIFSALEQYDVLREFVEKNELDEPRFREKVFNYLVRTSIGQPIGWWDMIDELVDKLEK